MTSPLILFGDINVDDITTDLFGDVLVKEALLWTVKQSSRVDEYLHAMMGTVSFSAEVTVQNLHILE